MNVQILNCLDKIKNSCQNKISVSFSDAFVTFHFD